MIDYIVKNAGEELAARGFPVEVVYGYPYPRSAGYPGHMLIQIDRDRQQGDTPPTASRAQGGGGPTKDSRGMRESGAVARLYARSEVAGATQADHDRVMDLLVDAFFVFLQEWGTKARAGTLTVTSSRYVERSEAQLTEDSGEWPAAWYEIRFRVPRDLRDHNYDREGKPTGAISRVHTTHHVRLEGRPESTPEVTISGVPAPSV